MSCLGRGSQIGDLMMEENSPEVAAHVQELQEYCERNRHAVAQAIVRR